MLRCPSWSANTAESCCLPVPQCRIAHSAVQTTVCSGRDHCSQFFSATCHTHRQPSYSQQTLCCCLVATCLRRIRSQTLKGLRIEWLLTAKYPMSDDVLLMTAWITTRFPRQRFALQIAMHQHFAQQHCPSAACTGSQLRAAGLRAASRTQSLRSVLDTPCACLS